MTEEEFNEGLERLKAKDNSPKTEEFALYCIEVIKYHLLPRLGKSPELEETAHDIFTQKIFENENLGYIHKPVPWLNKIADNYVNTKSKKDKR
ncbi:MAG: hypothetical protein HDQ88_06480, partial [Clostridia bacterium]|nr:hypothetical protein [Clostridia bacterium]